MSEVHFISSTELCRKMAKIFERPVTPTLLWSLRQAHEEKIGPVPLFGGSLCWSDSAVAAIEGLLRERWQKAVAK